MLSFTVIKAVSRCSSPRLGRLSLKSRKEILTPGFIATASRGVVPHLTSDVQSAHTSIGGLYMAVEDCGCLPNHTVTGCLDC
jgi:queuine tRNA-ribosyltransferase subunit QTRTD1